MREISAHELVRTRDCVTPGCPFEAEKGSMTCRECDRKALEQAQSPKLPDRVLVALRGGPRRAADIARELGANVGSVATTLSVLAGRDGRAVRLARGLYGLPGATVPEGEPQTERVVAAVSEQASDISPEPSPSETVARIEPEDALALAHLLRTVADAIDTGLFRGEAGAQLMDGLAFEIRRKIRAERQAA